MIPPFNLGGVLPPFLGSTPGANAALSSPYDCDPAELVQRFFTSPIRGSLLLGLFKFREALRAIGIVDGYQWIDGSFTEDVEREGRVPQDIDVVTLSYRPAHVATPADWGAFVAAHSAGVFSRPVNRSAYGCDTLFVDLSIHPHLLVRRAIYWHSLLSHQRVSFQWKGMVSLGLSADDAPALALLAAGGVT